MAASRPQPCAPSLTASHWGTSIPSSRMEVDTGRRRSVWKAPSAFLACLSEWVREPGPLARADAHLARAAEKDPADAIPAPAHSLPEQRLEGIDEQRAGSRAAARR